MNTLSRPSMKDAPTPENVQVLTRNQIQPDSASIKLWKVVVGATLDSALTIGLLIYGNK